MTKLLIQEYPLIVLPQLAKAVGLNEAIVLQQIHYWVHGYQAARDPYHYQDGHWWVWNTYDGWKTNFPFWSTRTIRRTIAGLRKPYVPSATAKANGRVAHGALVICSSFNKKGFDKTLWYRIDYAELANRTDCLDDVDNLSTPIPETTSETIKDPPRSTVGGYGAKTAPKPPESSPPADKPPPKRKRDPRTDYPAIQAFRKVVARYPPKVLWDDVIRVLGDVPREDDMLRCYKEWMKRGYNPTNRNWLFEWYVSGIPPRQVKTHSVQDETAQVIQRFEERHRGED